MATFVLLWHPVTILVTVTTNPDNLTNDVLILKFRNIFPLKEISSKFLLRGLQKCIRSLTFYGELCHLFFRFKMVYFDAKIK